MTAPESQRDRDLRVMASIVAERQSAAQQKAERAQVPVDPEVVRLANEQIAAAQSAGNNTLAIALKRRLHEYLTTPYPLSVKGNTAND